MEYEERDAGVDSQDHGPFPVLKSASIYRATKDSCKGYFGSNCTDDAENESYCRTSQWSQREMIVLFSLYNTIGLR